MHQRPELYIMNVCFCIGVQSQLEQRLLTGDGAITYQSTLCVLPDTVAGARRRHCFEGESEPRYRYYTDVWLCLYSGA